MNGGNHTSVGKILVSIVFVAWFVASIILMLYLSSHNQGALVVTVFGQYFLVFGTIAVISSIKEKKFQPITLIFPLLGIGCMVAGFIFQFGSEAVIKQANELLPYLFLSLFVIIGAAMVIITFFSSKRKHEVCTYCITGTCVELKSQYDDGYRTYCPVYEVYFRGEMVQISNNFYSNMHRVEVGETREIYINPENPSEFFEPREEKSTRRFLYILGTLFVIVGAFGLTMFIATK